MFYHARRHHNRQPRIVRGTNREVRESRRYTAIFQLLCRFLFADTTGTALCLLATELGLVDKTSPRS